MATINPFTTEGAKHIASLAGQAPVTQAVAPTSSVHTPTIDPFSTAGAQRLSHMTGQTLAPQTSQQIADPKALAVQANQQAASIYEQTKNQDIDLRESETIIRTLADNLAAKSTEAPKAPSLVDLFNTERSKLGLEPLEQDMARIDTEIERINTAALVQSDKADDMVTAQPFIDRIRGNISKEAQREIAFLNIERSAVARQMENKLNALQMTMQFTQQDYANASAQYNAEFSRSMQMLDLFTGLQDREERKQDRLADNARANLMTVTNLVQSSGKTFADMNDDQLRNVQQWEIQAGYPSGTFEAFGSAKPEAKILHTSSGTDAAGNQIVTFIYDDGTGKPGAMEVVKTGGLAASARSGGGGSGGGGGTGGADGSQENEYAEAEAYVAANPKETDEALESALVRDSNLSVKEINAILANRPNKVTLSDDEVRSLAITAIENSFEKKFWSSRATELKNTKAFVKKNLGAVIKVLGTDLTPADKQNFLSRIESITLDDIDV